MTKKLSNKQRNTTTLIEDFNCTETITKNKTIRRTNMTTKTIMEKLPTKSKRRKCFICSSVIADETKPKMIKKGKKIPCNVNLESLYTERLGKAQENQEQMVAH